MRTDDIVTELDTGATFLLGKDGRRYTMADLEAAEGAASRGDPAAAAMLRAVDLGVDDHGRRRSPAELAAAFERALDDCPLCREARACGEEAVRWSAADLLAREPRRHARRRGRGWRGRR